MNVQRQHLDELPAWRWGRLVLHEPTTTLTDLVLALVCAWSAARLVADSQFDSARWWWAIAFALTGAGAVAGAATHGLARLPVAIRAALWRVVLISMGAMGLAMVFAALRIASADDLSPLRWGGGVAMLVYVVAVVWRVEYRWAVVAYGSAMLMVAVIFVARWADQHAAPWVLGGIAISAVAAIVQQRRVRWHRHFNHNDLYHVLQLAALVLFYRAGTLLPGGV